MNVMLTFFILHLSVLCDIRFFCRPHRTNNCTKVRKERKKKVLLQKKKKNFMRSPSSSN